MGQPGETIGGGGRLAGTPSLEAVLPELARTAVGDGLRRPRLGRARGLAAQRQLVDARCLGQVGPALEPARQLGIAGARRLRGEVACGQDVAEEQVVLQLADQPLGARPVALPLQGEDLAVAREVGGGQAARQEVGLARRGALVRQGGEPCWGGFGRGRQGAGQQGEQRQAERQPHAAASDSWRRRVRRSRQASRFCRGWRSR